MKEKDPGGSGDDRRDHTAGKSASDRRAERETACGEECRNTYGSDPGAQSGGRGRVFIRDHRRTFHSPGKNMDEVLREAFAEPVSGRVPEQ